MLVHCFVAARQGGTLGDLMYDLPGCLHLVWIVVSRGKLSRSRVPVPWVVLVPLVLHKHVKVGEIVHVAHFVVVRRQCGKSGGVQLMQNVLKLQ